MWVSCASTENEPPTTPEVVIAYELNRPLFGGDVCLRLGASVTKPSAAPDTWAGHLAVAAAIYKIDQSAVPGETTL
jgi:hypothetical protein